jgi:hypothetical protein
MTRREASKMVKSAETRWLICAQEARYVTVICSAVSPESTFSLLSNAPRLVHGDTDRKSRNDKLFFTEKHGLIR